MQHIPGQEATAERGLSRSGSGSPATSNNTNGGGSGLQLPPTLSPPAPAVQQQQQHQQQQQEVVGGRPNSGGVHHGSLQQAIGGALHGEAHPNAGGGHLGSLEGSGGGGLSGLDDVSVRVQQIQLIEQLSGAGPRAAQAAYPQHMQAQHMQPQYGQQQPQLQQPQQQQQQQRSPHLMPSGQGHPMLGAGDPRLASAAAGHTLGGAVCYAQLSPPPPPLHMAAGLGPNAFYEQLRYRDAQIAKLAGTLAHYRAWAAQVQARYQMFNAEAARPARRIYVGGLPAGTQELELRQYINDLLIKTGGAAAPGFPINSCKLYPEKNFAFLEFRSVEEASNCMAFDGIAFRDCYLKIRRPNNYEPDVCIMLGPPDPDPTMDLTALDIVKTVVLDSPNKLFVGGLPCDWTEEQVKDLLLPFGVLKAFNLVMDKNTGNSKGYAFCEYADTALTNYVIQALNGKPVGNKFLTVKRALAPAPTSPFDPQLS